MLGYQAKEKASMEKATIIGIDLAKRVFQVHGAAQDGRPVFRKKVSRAQLLGFLAKQSPAVVAMEACATAHGWGRAISGLGHEVRLIPPIYVKPFVRRQKNDAADAEAITEAASRPTMRFVALKTEEQQARSMIFRTRDLLVRQRTQLMNALRGHLAEHGIVAAQGLAKVKVLAAALREAVEGSVHPLVRELGQRYLDHIARAVRQRWGSVTSVAC
jgi:transposase